MIKTYLKNEGSRKGMFSGKWQLFVIMVLMTAFLSAAPAEHDPKAVKLMDDYIEATGGKAAYKNIRNRIAKVRIMIGASGIELKGTMYRELPNKAYTNLQSDVTGKIQQGSNGKIAWEIMAMTGARIKEGEELASALLSDRIDGELNWRELYEKVEVTGEETIDGHPCYIVTSIPKGINTPRIAYIDKNTKLIRKGVSKVVTPQGTVNIETYPSDYKKVDGILMPLKMKMLQMGQEMTVIVDEVKHNTEIPGKTFELPAEIKALTQKKAPETKTTEK